MFIHLIESITCNNLHVLSVQSHIRRVRPVFCPSKDSLAALITRALRRSEEISNVFSDKWSSTFALKDPFQKKKVVIESLLAETLRKHRFSQVKDAASQENGLCYGHCTTSTSQERAVLHNYNEGR